MGHLVFSIGSVISTSISTKPIRGLALLQKPIMAHRSLFAFAATQKRTADRRVYQEPFEEAICEGYQIPAGSSPRLYFWLGFHTYDSQTGHVATCYGVDRLDESVAS